MLRFEWNSLRIGDDVGVHDPLGADFTLRPGVVVMVETKGRMQPNAVGVRVADGGGPKVLWPPYVAVHKAPYEPAASCWRCEALAPLPAPPSRPAGIPQPA